MKYEEVEDFVYLGVLLTNKYEEAKKIDAKAGRCSGSVRSNCLGRRTKIIIYKTWVVNKKSQEKLLR